MAQLTLEELAERLGEELVGITDAKEHRLILATLRSVAADAFTTAATIVRKRHVGLDAQKQLHAGERDTAKHELAVVHGHLEGCAGALRAGLAS